MGFLCTLLNRCPVGEHYIGEKSIPISLMPGHIHGKHGCRRSVKPLRFRVVGCGESFLGVGYLADLFH